MELIQNKVVQIIFFLTILILLVILIFTVTNTIQEAAQYRTCKSSVETHAKLISLTLPAKSEEIDCPADKVTLKGDERNVKSQLADEMRECWDIYGEGKLNLFNGEGVFCSVCSIINTKEQKKVIGFRKYLAESFIPNGKETYLSYLQDFKSQDAQTVKGYEEAVIRKSANEQMTFNKDESYAVIFVDVKGQNLLKNYLKKSPQFTAAAGTVAAGATTALAGAGIIVATGVFVAKGGGLMAATTVGAVPGAIVAGVGALIILGGVTYGFIEARIANNEFEHYSEVLLRPYNNETLTKEIGCTKIPVRLYSE